METNSENYENGVQRFTSDWSATFSTPVLLSCFRFLECDLAALVLWHLWDLLYLCHSLWQMLRSMFYPFLSFSQHRLLSRDSINMRARIQGAVHFPPYTFIQHNLGESTSGSMPWKSPWPDALLTSTSVDWAHLDTSHGAKGLTQTIIQSSQQP